MSDELTDAELIQWLRCDWGNLPRHTRIADRLEQLAGENKTLRDQRDHAMADITAITAERNRLREDNARLAGVVEAGKQGWKKTIQENDRLRKALEPANDAIGAYLYDGDYKGNWSELLIKIRTALGKYEER